MLPSSSPRSTPRTVTLHKDTREDKLGLTFFSKWEVERRAKPLSADEQMILAQSAVLERIAGSNAPAADLFVPGERIVLIDEVPVQDPHDAVRKLLSAQGDIVVQVMPAFDGFNLSQPFEPLPYLTPAEEEGDERLPSERAPLPPLDPRGLPPPLLPQNQVPLPPLDAERTDELLSSARKRLQARLQESTIVPSSVFIDDSGAVCACVTVPKGTKGSVLVDVWPHAEPKVLVTKPVPHGLNPGDTFLAKLVESHERRERGIVRAHCAEGECDYTFDADGSIGVVIEAAKRGPKGRKPQLLISEVKRGTWAERLGVPAEGAITKVNGVVLKGSADQQMQQATLLVRSRPLNLTVLTKPKHSSVTTKASASLFGFRKAAKAQPPVPTPIVATPADSDRSDRPAHKAPVHDAAAAVQVM